MISNLVARTLEIAITQIGVRERGRNKGPEVEIYQRAVPGCGPGDPYCACFVFWCFSQAAFELGVDNPCPRTSGALRMMRMSQIGYHVDIPEPGCLFFLDSKGNDGVGAGHVGFVESIAGDSGLVTIEANTNPRAPGLARDGDGVYRRTRRRGEVFAYVDYSRLLLPLPSRSMDVA